MVNSDSKRRFSRSTAVTIGTFDGVHYGHKQLVAEAQALAAGQDLAVVVVTFDRHPASVVRPQSTPLLLTTLDHKLELLRATDIDDIVVLHFDVARAAETAEEFVTAMLVDELDAKFVVVGSNFRFGQRQKGDVELLEKMGAAAGFTTKGLELVTDDDLQEVVSSTRIRGLVAEGDVEHAAKLLGRPHEVRGVVAELSGADQARLGAVASTALALPKQGHYRALVGPVNGEGRETIVRVPERVPDAPFGYEIVLGTRDMPFGAVDGESAPTGAWFSVKFLSPA